MQIIMHAVSCKHSNMMVLWLLYVDKSATKHNVGVQSKKQKNLRGASSFSSQRLIVLSLHLMYLLLSFRFLHLFKPELHCYTI